MVPVGFCGLVHKAPLADTGVVDQDVEATILGNSLFDCRLPLRFTGHIEAYEKAVATRVSDLLGD